MRSPGAGWSCTGDREAGLLSTKAPRTAHPRDGRTWLRALPALAHDAAVLDRVVAALDRCIALPGAMLRLVVAQPMLLMFLVLAAGCQALEAFTFIRCGTRSRVRGWSAAAVSLPCSTFSDTRTSSRRNATRS